MSPVPRPALPSSATVGGFRAVDVLSVSASAAWLRARRDGRLYVLKVPTIGAARGDGWRRLTREAALLRQLAGGAFPSLVAAGTFDTADADAVPYLVTDLPDGAPLADVLARQKRPDVPLAARVLRGLLGALSSAHARGFVHGALRPSTLTLLRAGSVRVEDLQLGLGAATPALARRRPLFSSLDCAAPEQAGDPRDVDGRADLFAAGLIAYAMMTHALPYDLVDPSRAALEPASRRNPEIGEALAELVSGLLARARDARPASADVALSELQRALG